MFEAARPRNEDGQAIPKPPLELPVQDIRLALVEYDKEGREMHGVSEKAFKAPIIGSRTSEMDENYTGQYALLGRPAETKTEDPEEDPNLLYTNVTHPWSAFICGLQGSGKSHTLSSMLGKYPSLKPLPQVSR